MQTLTENEHTENFHCRTFFRNFGRAANSFLCRDRFRRAVLFWSSRSSSNCGGLNFAIRPLTFCKRESCRRRIDRFEPAWAAFRANFECSSQSAPSTSRADAQVWTARPGFAARASSGLTRGQNSAEGRPTIRERTFGSRRHYDYRKDSLGCRTSPRRSSSAIIDNLDTRPDRALIKVKPKGLRPSFYNSECIFDKRFFNRAPDNFGIVQTIDTHQRRSKCQS